MFLLILSICFNTLFNHLKGLVILGVITYEGDLQVTDTSSNNKIFLKHFGKEIFQIITLHIFKSLNMPRMVVYAKEKLNYDLKQCDFQDYINHANQSHDYSKHHEYEKHHSYLEC